MGKRRFVVHAHKRIGEPLHFDLMLEKGDVLQTFRLALPPQMFAQTSCEATKIDDHPRRFLTYEGSVHHGTGRITAVDRGTYERARDSEKRVELRFCGTLLKGRYALGQLEEHTWRFEHLTNEASDSRNHRRH